MSKTFGYVGVNTEQQKVLSDLNDAFAALEERIVIHVPAGRRKSLALTALEEASMWANKAISKG